MTIDTEHPACCKDPASCTLSYAAHLIGFGLSQAITPTRTAVRAEKVRDYNPPKDPSWEAGVAGERRSDGSFMPYLDAHRDPMGVKEYGEKRHVLEEGRRRLQTDPSVFASERSTTP